MNLIRKTYDTTEVQITSFQSTKGITEYHIFFQQTNCLEDFTLSYSTYKMFTPVQWKSCRVIRSLFSGVIF